MWRPPFAVLGHSGPQEAHSQPAQPLGFAGRGRAGQRPPCHVNFLFLHVVDQLGVWVKLFLDKKEKNGC